MFEKSEIKMMKSMIDFWFAILVISSVQVEAYADDFCERYGTDIRAKIENTVKSVNENKKQITYSLVNKEKSNLPIVRFVLDTKTLETDPQSPDNWKVNIIGKNEERSLRFNPKSFKEGFIYPGNQVDGFRISLSGRIGLIRFKSSGGNYGPIVFQKVKKDDVKNLCPGTYWAGSTEAGLDYVEGITIGPIPKDQISAETRIRRSGEKEWTGKYNASEGELLAFSPIEKGKVEVALLETEDLDLDKVKVSSIEFGRGKAKPLKAKISNCEISPNETKKALLMEFDIYDVNVLCNVSHAIFLEAETKEGNPIFGGVKINPTACTQANWIREATKMIESGQLDLPEGEYKTK